MAEHRPSRRTIIKATGALGTIAALSVPVAVLPKAEAGEHADAELLALGRELESLWAREHELVLEACRLHEVADLNRPAPAPALLAYEHDGSPLFEREMDGRYCLDRQVQDHVADVERCWRVLGFREGPCPEADLLPLLEEWREAGREVRRQSGASAADDAVDGVRKDATAIYDRIIAAEASTREGMQVKLRAIERHCPGMNCKSWLEARADSTAQAHSNRLAFSALRDAIQLIGIGGL